MTPKIYFDDVWQRCELFVALHGYVTANATAADLQPDELLRAEWAARVSALDLYVRSEIVTKNLVEIFAGKRTPAGPVRASRASSDLRRSVDADTGR